MVVFAFCWLLIIIKKLIKIKLIIKMAKIIFWAFLNAIALKKIPDPSQQQEKHDPNQF